MVMSLGYPNAQAIARAVSEGMLGRGIELATPLPYNRFDKIDVSTWWVTPSKENPAYRHGKFAFVPELGGRSAFFCGLHVEKGFGRSVEPLMKRAKMKRQLMNDDWLWHQFLADLAAGKLDVPARAIAKGVGYSARVLVQAYHYKPSGDGDFDPYDTGDDWDQVEFGADGAKIEFDGIGSRTPRSLLADAARAKALVGLAEALARIPDHEWVWVNFWLGHDFTLDLKPGCWSAAELYDGLLKPLRPWFA